MVASASVTYGPSGLHLARGRVGAEDLQAGIDGGNTTAAGPAAGRSPAAMNQATSMFLVVRRSAFVPCPCAR
jgi:hypothetical protein